MICTQFLQSKPPSFFILEILKVKTILRTLCRVIGLIGMKNWSKRNLVCLYWSGYCTTCTHRCYPTTAGRGHFELLGFPPGPNRTSLDNLATSGSPKVSMLTPSLVRTLVQRVTQCNRTPVLKPSSNSSLPNAWITEPATDPSQQKQWK